ncbi:MAG TPA: S41 family peptidase, partial [Methylomirabilota bacterium]|nr:S41 family peptidase [Methylomirabilota bacterium]
KFEKSGRLGGLIIDLRNNPGGLLSSAVEVSEEFLGEGKLIVYTEGRVRNQNMRFTAHAKKAITDVPLVVLVNHGSASASEIVAGAIQDHGRGVVLGQQTFGKGSVQTIIPLSDGSGLRLTTARYFTPKGRSIHGKGITPDIVIEPPKEEASAVKPGTPPPSEADLMKRDVQLQRAIEILKATRILEKTKPTQTAG